MWWGGSSWGKCAREQGAARGSGKLLSHCLAVIFVYRLWTASDFALLTHHDHNSVLGPPLTTCDASLEVILRPPLALR